MSYASQQFLINDNSSIANFKSWGSAISAAIAAMGWVQQNDTGQVVWTASVATLTQATRSGGNTTYTYTGSLTGPALRIGMSMIITGFTNGGNNVTATITALNGTTDFTVVNGTGVNETHAGSATTTAIAAVPGASTYTYEIWAPADALQTGATAFYLKFEYGTDTTHPQIQISLGTSTNGAGTLSGTTTTLANTSTNPPTNQGSTTYDCWFSGDTNRLGMLLWRNHPSQGGPVWVVIERTKNTDGTDSSDGVSVWLSGVNKGAWSSYQAIVFGTGATTAITRACMAYDGQSSAQSFNNSVPFYPIFSLYGKVGNPATVLTMHHSEDTVDASLIAVSLYGATRTYFCSVAGADCFRGVFTTGRVGLRWD